MNELDNKAAERLKALLALPTPSHSDECGSEGYFDPWDAFDNITGAYNSLIDEVAIHTLEAIREGKNFELIASKHGLFVEFFLHVLAGHRYVEYGTSPRGAWATHGLVEPLLDEWIAKWRACYLLSWGEEAKEFAL